MEKAERYLHIGLSVLLVVCTGFLLYELIILKAIPNSYLFLGIGVFCVIDFLLIFLMDFFFKKRWAKNLCAVVCAGVIALCSLGGYYVQATHELLAVVTNPSTGSNFVSVIVKESSDYESILDLNGKNIGILRTISRSRTEACQEDIASHQVEVSYQNYDSLNTLAQAFYDSETEAIILPEASRSVLKELEHFTNFDANTRVLFQTELDAATMEAESVEDITAYPFHVLITGSDSRIDIDEDARSDVNMLVSVNPQKHTILLTSIPRDYYVETVCDAADGCQNGAMDKLTHTGMTGVNTTKRTIENLFGIEINYTFKVGFESLEGIVDALGGIDVYVPEEAAVAASTQTRGFSIAAGNQHIDGLTALNFSRERYAYADGDRQRTRNQQIVLMGIIDAMTSPSILANYTSLLEAVAGTFQTTMSADEMAALVQFQLEENPQWTIEQYMVNGTGDNLMCAQLGVSAYVMVPDQTTIQTAKEKITAVMDGIQTEE